MWWQTEELIRTAVIKRVFVYTPGSHQLQGDSRVTVGDQHRDAESWWDTWNNGAVFAVHLKDEFAEHILELVCSNKNPFPPCNTKTCLNFKYFCELHGKLLFSAKPSAAQVTPRAHYFLGKHFKDKIGLISLCQIRVFHLSSWREMEKLINAICWRRYLWIYSSLKPLGGWI